MKTFYFIIMLISLLIIAITTMGLALMWIANYLGLPHA